VTQLYIWKGGVIVEKKNAHLNSSISCLAASKFHSSTLSSPDYFVSGGLDGSVNLWEMKNPSEGSIHTIEKRFEYPLKGDKSSDEAINEHPEFHIQSLQFRTQG